MNLADVVMASICVLAILVFICIHLKTQATLRPLTRRPRPPIQVNPQPRPGQQLGRCVHCGFVTEEQIELHDNGRQTYWRCLSIECNAFGWRTEIRELISPAPEPPSDTPSTTPQRRAIRFHRRE